MTRHRGYDSSGRQEAARRTRSTILATARRLLLTGGYGAMTVASLAAEAGVSPQTVYNSVGGKAEVVKAVYDVALAGDDAPVAMSDRPEFVAMRESDDTEAFLRAYAAWTRRIHERVGPLLGTLLDGGGGDPGLRHLVTTIEAERRTGNTHAVDMLRAAHGLRRGLTRERAVDVLWTLTAPEVADRLLRRCGWSAAAYERWLAGQLVAALGDSRQPGVSG